jgi:hypothetical protein
MSEYPCSSVCTFCRSWALRLRAGKGTGRCHFSVFVFGLCFYAEVDVTEFTLVTDDTVSRVP